MLAVAEGKFPFASTSDGPASSNGGYWGMIQAICDDDAPLPGAQMSSKFNLFIALCLRKTPTERATAAELLDCPLISEWKSKEKLSSTLTKAAAPNALVHFAISSAHALTHY